MISKWYWEHTLIIQKPISDVINIKFSSIREQLKYILLLITLLTKNEYETSNSRICPFKQVSEIRRTFVIENWRIYLHINQLLALEAATRGVLQEKVFHKISQNSQESTCARASFLIKLQAMLGWNWQKIKQMLTNTLGLNFCYLKIIRFLHSNIIEYILKMYKKWSASVLMTIYD